MAIHSFTTDSPPQTKAPQDNRADHTAAPAATAPLTVAALCREIGRRMRAQRRARGLSQEELGWRAGYHRTHISQIERGTSNPTLTTLYHLALALGVPLTAFCPAAAPDDHPVSSGEGGAAR